MKYFVDPKSGQVFAYEEDGSQDEYISKNLIAMTDDQVSDHLNPKPTEEQILQRNTAMEADLSSAASIAMTPLFLSLQLGGETDGEKEKAEEWRGYYRKLKAVDLSAEAPEWPTIPN